MKTVIANIVMKMGLFGLPLLLLILATAFYGPKVNSIAPHVEDKQPNFLFILVDDQSPWDLSIYNPQSELTTPNINSIADRGTIIDAAYHMGSWSGAVCTPSRHMIMTGRYLWDLPSYGKQFDNPNCPVDIVQNTLGAVFNRAGYQTMRTCKKGNTYPAANAQFSILHEASKRGGGVETGSAWHADQVLNFLEDRKNSLSEEQPFFIFLGFSHPHDPRNGTDSLLNKYGAINLTDTLEQPVYSSRLPEMPQNYLPEHPFFHGHPNLRDEERVEGVWKRRDSLTVRNEIGREFACSENIDIQIGRVLDRLKENGELENTYVIYTSDHGIAIGRHGLMGKQNLYEHTWRVPMLIAGPGIPHKRVKGNVYLADLLPTFCSLAHIPIPQTVQSLDFSRILLGDLEQVRDVLFGVYCGGTKPGMRSVRKGDWKLIKYDLMEGEVRETQLFHLGKNPLELLAEHDSTRLWLRNLAYDPIHSEVRQELEQLLKIQMEIHRDPYKLWDQ